MRGQEDGENKGGRGVRRWIEKEEERRQMRTGECSPGELPAGMVGLRQFLLKKRLGPYKAFCRDKRDTRLQLGG